MQHSSAFKLSCRQQFAVLALLVAVLFLPPLSAAGAAEAGQPPARIRVERGHPWRPPFGLDRIGQPLNAVVELDSNPPSSEVALVAYLDGEEIARKTLTLTGQAPATGRASFETWPTELVLMAKSAQDEAVELARQTIEPAPFEADAIARPDQIINPVDLGAVLVPADWLILADGQQGTIDVAAICRTGDVPGARVTAWFESAPTAKTVAEMALV